MSAKPLALSFLCLLLAVFLVYYGLEVAEKGIQEILALEGPCRSFAFRVNDGQICIVFAGKNYFLPYSSCIAKLKMFFYLWD